MNATVSEALSGAATGGTATPSSSAVIPAGTGVPANDGGQAGELSTEKLETSLQQYFKGASAPATAPDGAGTTGGGEPTEGGGEAAAGQGSSPAAGSTSEDPNGDGEERWPRTAIDTVTALRADRREMKAEMKLLADELAEIKKAGTPRKPGGEEPESTHVPSAESDAVKGLKGKEATERAVVQWTKAQLRQLDRNPDAVLAELQAQKVTLGDMSPEGIKAWLETTQDAAEEKLRELVIQREITVREERGSLQNEQRTHGQQAIALMPELKDEKSERYTKWAWTLNEYPGIAKHPRAAMAAMVHVLGMEALEALMAKGGNGQSGAAAAHPRTQPQPEPRRQVPPAPALPKSGTVASPPATEGNAVDALRDKFFKTGKPEDRAAWMKAVLNQPKA